MTTTSTSAYLTLTRIAGEPDRLFESYMEATDVMASVGHDHDLLLHAAAKTDNGILIANLWPSREQSEAAARDPRRLAQLERYGITADQVRREHHEVMTYGPGAPDSRRRG